MKDESTLVNMSDDMLLSKSHAQFHLQVQAMSKDMV